MPPALPGVTILLASYQGAKHLAGQLDSIRAQDHAKWALWVSDDGSTDGTREIIEAFRRETPTHDIRLVQGPRRGAAANFLSLMCHPDLQPGHVALADQDDLWYPHKLRHALMALMPHEGPAIHSAQSRHVDTQGHPLGFSRAHSGPPSFGNALVQNRVAGHCAVLNPAALALVRAIGPVEVPFHDWWLYLLVTGAGGTITVSPEVVLDYRQHRENVLGAHRGLPARLARVTMVLDSTYRDWQAQNHRALTLARPFLTPAARELMDAFDAAPARGINRARTQARLGLTRDRLSSTTILRLAALLGRV